MTAAASARPSRPDLGLYIDGAWRAGAGRKTEPVIDPASEEVVGTLPHATTADLDDALAAAGRAWPDWRRTSAQARAAIICRAAAILRRDADRIAARVSGEQGKTLAESRNEVLNSAEMLEWFADEGRRACGRLVPSRVLHHDLIVRKVPVGPVAAFCAWNAPVQTPIRKIAPALAAGCTIIVKGSEEVPAGLVEIAAAFDEAGLPPGVLNVVFGVPATISGHLIASPVIRKIAFTGSVPVGKHLAALAAAEMKPATMELGGHSAVFVFDDADPAAIARAAVTAKFRNAGQICYAPTRFYICDRHFDAFAESLSEHAKALRVGPADNPASVIGPLTNARRLKATEELVADALDCGARLLAGGHRIGERGYFYAPTVLADVPDRARAMTEEPFGPIAMLNRFGGGADEAVRLANRLEYGLAAYAFTADRGTALAFLRGVESGTVGINSFQVTVPESPFGGVKDSGIGREGGAEGLEAYLVTKFVSAA